MASTLFGQYYTTKSSTSQKYQNYNYICSTADDGTNNSVIFDDSTVSLVDANGNKISSLDLSNIQAKPITDYRSGSFTLNAGEVRFIEGLEYGKSYKKMYFQIPDKVIEIFGEHWEDHCNVDFNLIYNEILNLKEYNLKTAYDSEDEVSVIYKIKHLISALGLEDSIDVDVVDITDSMGDEHKYFVFSSLLLGYDFLIESFRLHTLKYAYYIDEETSTAVEVNVGYDTNVMPLYGSIQGFSETTYTIKYETGSTYTIKESEDNVVFDNGEPLNTQSKTFYVGNYDRNDIPDDPESSEHFYRELTSNNSTITESSVGETEPEDSSDNVDASVDSSVIYDASGNPVVDSSTEDSSTDSSVSIDDIINGDVDIPEDETVIETSDGKTIHLFPEKYYDIEADYSLEISAFKYLNGASRVWFFVPEIPEGDEQNFSLKLNHVKDYVTDFVPVDIDVSVITYRKEMVDVYATERNESERHEVEKKQETGTRFKDANGMITYVNHNHPNSVTIAKRHIGMYRYLEYVDVHCDWLNFGQFYGVVTNADDPETNDRNLANSVFILNKNEYPVKVNYFIGV